MALRRSRRHSSHRRPLHGASWLSILLALILLLSALLPGATLAPRPAQARTATELPVANSVTTLLTPPRQAANTWTICEDGCDFVLIRTAINDNSVVAGDTLLVMDAVHTEGSIWVNKDVTIRGQGARNTIIQATDDPPDPSRGSAQLITIQGDTTVTIVDVTLRYGSSIGWQDGTAIAVAEHEHGDAVAIASAEGEMDFRGAGITVRGNLTLDRSVVSDNYIIITSTMRALASATAPITATARAHAWAETALYARGAGIHNTGNLTVTNSTIANNEIHAQGVAQAWAEASGGVITETAAATSVVQIAGAAIYNGGAMWLTNSTVSGNRAHISNTAQASNELEPVPLDASGSTSQVPGENPSVQHVTGSDRAYVEIVSDSDGQRTVTTSDSIPDTPHLAQDENVSSAQVENQAVAGIYNAGEATVHFSTISDNSALAETEISGEQTSVMSEEIGGLFNESGASLNLNSIIVAAQASGTDCAQTAGSSSGYNLDSDGTCGLSGTGDQSNPDTFLAPLDNYGGPTPTQALLSGDPAIDAADPACPGPDTSGDQRGVARPVDGDNDSSARCDVGAVEAMIDVDTSLSKSAAPGSVIAGDDVFTYTLTMQSDGPETTPLAVTFDTLPQPFQYLGSEGGCQEPDAQNRTICMAPDVGDGDERVFELSAQAAPDAVVLEPDGARLVTNVAIVRPVGIDPNPANDQAQTGVLVEDSADLQVTKQSRPDSSVQAGERFTYTVAVDNLGPSFARGLRLADNILSAGDVTLVAINEDPDRADACTTAGVPSGTILICRLNEPLEPQGTPGASGRWLIEVVVTAEEAQDIENVVQVDTGPGAYPAAGVAWINGTPDPDPDNNEASTFISVEGVSDLALSGAVLGQRQVDGQPGNTFTLTPNQVTAGARLTYTLAVRNDGPSTAESVLLEHYVPEALETEEATINTTGGSCDAELPADRANPLRCELGELTPGQVISVTVAARTSPTLPDDATLNSHASVSAATDDPQPDNDNVVLDAEANRRADIGSTITQTPQLALPGDVLTYVIAVENPGPSDAPTVAVTDTLPAGLQDVRWTCTAAGGAACAEAGGTGNIQHQVELPVSSVVTYTITGSVASCAVQENTATATFTDDPYAPNNSATADNPLACSHLPLVRSAPANEGPEG